MIVAESGGIAGIVESLKVVLTKGDFFVKDSVWSNGLEAYLKDLLEHLTQ
jgi:hypothetical protein